MFRSGLPMRTFFAFVCGILAALAGAAEVVTLPAAASSQGLNPFFSDVRVFNTSYTSTITLNATYGCFLGTCPDCGSGMEYAEGCAKCHVCGFSECG